MFPPPNGRGPLRRRPVGLYPPRSDWHSFAIGSVAIVVIAALCLFLLARMSG